MQKQTKQTNLFPIKPETKAAARMKIGRFIAQLCTILEAHIDQCHWCSQCKTHDCPERRPRGPSWCYRHATF